MTGYAALNLPSAIRIARTARKHAGEHRSNLPVEQQLDFEDDGMKPAEGRKRTGAGGKCRQATP